MLDNRSPRNPWDISKQQKYNPKGVQYISNIIYDYFTPQGDICRYCRGSLEDPLRPCIMSCPWRTHWSSGKRFKEGHPMVESKRPNPFGLFIKKTNLLFCYYYKLDFIFLGSVLHGMEIDHINSDPFDDRPENLVPILSQTDNLQKGKDYKKLQTEFRKLWEIKEKGARYFTKEIESEMIDIVNKLSSYKRVFPDRFYQLLIYMQQAIGQNRILVPPKSWWVHYKNSEILEYVEKKLIEEPDEYYHPEEIEEKNET